MSVCLAFFFCSSTKCQSIPRSLELGITQLKYFFVTLSLCLSGLWQSNVALSLWWRNPVLQCVFKTVKTLFEWQKENAWNPLPYYWPQSLLSVSILMAWSGFFFLALNSGFSQVLASFSLILNCVFTDCLWCLFPTSPSNGFSCSLPDLPLQCNGSMVLERSAHQNFPHLCLFQCVRTFRHSLCLHSNFMLPV